MTSWIRELGLGARLALAGARGATLLTAAGVALGVGLLLLAASRARSRVARAGDTLSLIHI